MGEAVIEGRINKGLLPSTEVETGIARGKDSAHGCAFDLEKPGSVEGEVVTGEANKEEFKN